ncbi:TPA: hypothetical protein AABK65_07620 [Neisseria gonorrhoeae]
MKEVGKKENPAPHKHPGARFGHCKVNLCKLKVYWTDFPKKLPCFQKRGGKRPPDFAVFLRRQGVRRADREKRLAYNVNPL